MPFIKRTNYFDQITVLFSCKEKSKKDYKTDKLVTICHICYLLQGVHRCLPRLDPSPCRPWGHSWLGTYLFGSNSAVTIYLPRPREMRSAIPGFPLAIRRYNYSLLKQSTTLKNINLRLLVGILLHSRGQDQQSLNGNMTKHLTISFQK